MTWGRQGRVHTHNVLCGPDCRYRLLYEGSQTSLSDMAARQAVALTRVARLRDAMIMMLKRNRPIDFAAAESRIGQRMQYTDDETLLALVNDFFVEDHFSTVNVEGLVQLREALEASGIKLPSGTNLGEWATALRTSTLHSDRTTSAEPSKPNGKHFRDRRHQGGPSMKNTSSAPAQPVEDQEMPSWPDPPKDEPIIPDDALADLFDFASSVPESPKVTESTPPVETTTPVASADKRDRSKESPATEVIEVEDDSLADLFGDLLAPETSEEEEDSLADLFEDLEVSTTEPAVTVASDDEPKAEDILTPTPLSRRAQRQARRAGGTSLRPAPTQTVKPADSPTAEETPQASVPEEARTSPSSASPGDRPALKRPAASAADRPALKRPSPTTSDAPPVINTQPAPKIPASTSNTPRPTLVAPLRPEIYPSPLRKNRRVAQTRTVRTQAMDADLDIPGLPQEIDGGVEDHLRDRLIAAACIPRPVFAADLVSIAGSPNAVAAWESSMLSNLETSPIRFIGAKSRHKLRGSLILPIADLRDGTDFNESLWYKCMRDYKGTALYELGVLLYRYGENVTTWKLLPHTVIIKLGLPTGVVGVVVVLGRVKEPETKSATVASIESLLGERLSMMALLSITDPGREELLEVVSGSWVEKRWSPSFPVVVTTTWEFAADEGSSAIPVSG